MRWFDPVELLRSGARATLADLFGAYVDRRELQAALYPLAALEPFDYSSTEELWLDYVSDVGDGFNATYAVARLLARPTLSLPPPERTEDPPFETKRGRLLVMGGDEVYPTATPAQYHDRTVGPYSAALPWSPEPETAPHLFALPGNHDWYDGLTAFLRLFAQQRWIGGWKTHQRRSYFALKLPQHYWLWGIDIQLHADVDAPQLDYFRHHAELLAPSDRVILCTAEPSWVKNSQGPDDAGLSNLRYLSGLVERRGARVVLVLTGDSHHYSRYDDPRSGCLFITAGGGGAFLHGTHTLPERIALDSLKDADAGATTELTLKKTFPSRRTSELAVLAIWRFPFDNKAFALMWAVAWGMLGSTLTIDVPGSAFDASSAWPPGLASATSRVVDRASWAAYAGLGTLLSWATFRLALGDRLGPRLSRGVWLVVDTLPWLGSGAFLVAVLGSGDPSPLVQLFAALSTSPVGLGLVGLVALANVAFVRHRRRSVAWGLGVLHGAFHFLWWLLVLVAVAILVEPAVREWPGLRPGLTLTWLSLASVASGLVSAVVFALFLWFAGRYLPGQLNDVSSALGVEDYKNFLRLHLTRSGKLVVYPVGLSRVPRTWKVNPDDAPGASWIVPDESPGPEPRCIEPPLAFDPERGTWAAAELRSR